MIELQRNHRQFVYRGYQPKTRALCPFLRRGVECQDRRACYGSHDPELLRRRRCRHGSKCWYLTFGNCTQYHTREELDSRNGIEKLEGLKDPTALKAACKQETAFGDWYGIRDTEVLASFNCLGGSDVAVPGLPPAFIRPREVISFARKDMDACRDAFQSQPAEPPKFQPLAQAIRIQQPDRSLFSEFHIVTTAGCLRRLAKFLSEDRQNPLSKADRLDLEVQGDALFISRWEADPRNKLHTGYGKQFENRTVSYAHLPELQRSQSSHIALSYKMGDLKLAVQTEVDAIDCDCHASPCQPGTPPPPSPTIKRRLSGGRFDVLSLDTGDSKEAPNHGAYTFTQEGTRILHAGKPFNLSCCVEIKTRMKRPMMDKDIDFMEQLYFQRTSKLFLAVHRNGSFDLPHMRLFDVANELRRWEAEQQPLLARLVKFLEELRARAMKVAASAGGQCKMSIVLGNTGSQASGEQEAMLYTRPDGESMLPHEP